MIIYGKQVCLYALQRYEKMIQTVYVAKKGILPQALYEQYKPKIKFLENRWAQAMSKGGNHQGILVEMSEIEHVSLEQIKQGDFVVVLDGLTDAGNIGAIIRTAYVLGVDSVVATGIKQLNLSAITRTSSGAMLDMPFMIHDNILDLLHEFKQIGCISYGASMEGESLEKMTFSSRRVLVLGSEDKGLSKKAQSKLDRTLSIEMKREFDSLNVSAAAAIIIHRMSYAT
ncbi:MAG: 23S rRNA (guanosine(2251)-2'-O)-methyltransferase RlmB [Sulfurovum sp.]|nr:23S rRNA (guanosine(2251)-2'-O)-methyltransferase RlmB [Sulfurovum sp.]